jgi:hypothetical protein
MPVEGAHNRCDAPRNGLSFSAGPISSLAEGRAPNARTGGSRKMLSATGDRWFESISLQRRVLCEPTWSLAATWTGGLIGWPARRCGRPGRAPLCPRQQSAGPLLRGTGDTDYLCGNCGFVIASGMGPKQFVPVDSATCSACGAENEFPPELRI